MHSSSTAALAVAGRALALAALLGLLCSVGHAFAQSPVPKKESEIVASGGKVMSGRELAFMLTGNTGYYLFLADTGGVKAGVVTAAFFRDARTRILRYSNGKKFEGNWWMEGDNVCAEQQAIKQGHLCFSYYTVGPTIYVCVKPEGACNMVVRIALGNPEGI